MKRSPLLVVFTTILIDMIGFGIIIPVLPSYSVEMGATSFEVGIIFAVYSLMNFLFSPIWGTLSDRHGRRIIMIISIGITASSYFLFAFSNILILIFLSRLLAGIGSANISTAQACISDISTPDNRAKMMGFIGAAFGLGFIIGPPVGGFVKQHLGMEYVGIVAASLSSVNLLMALFLFPETIKVKNPKAVFTLLPFKELRIALKKEVIRDLFIINFLYIAAFSAMQATAALLWEQEYHLNELHIGYVFMVIGIASVIVQLGMVGWLNKNFGEKKLLTGGSLLMLCSLALFPIAPVEWFIPAISLIIILMALANGCITPALTTLISKNSPAHEQGQMLGLNFSFASLARVFGPLIGGFVYDWHFGLPYLIGVLLMATAWYFGERVLQLKDTTRMPAAD